MEKNEFTPIEFEYIKLGYKETSENVCSPLLGKEIDINTLLINTPNKIIMGEIDSRTWVIPLCIRYSISLRRSLKYANAPHNMITIKNIQDDSMFSGQIYADQPEGALLFSDDYNKEAWEEGQAMIVEAQKYKDEELDKGQFEDGYRNINALQYVTAQLVSGQYEIWYSCSGLESNHVLIEIINCMP